MNTISHPIRYFFSGKGGVGKTTMACATALHHAGMGKRTLLISTDPASNIGDVLGQRIGYGVVEVKGMSNLWATEIDPDDAVKHYKENALAPYREMLPEEIVASLEEQLSGPCTVEVAAFDRFIEFMDSKDFEVLVFDTAPTGHTLRLLELSVDWSKYIDAAAQGSGQTCIGPVQTVQGAKARYESATKMLKDQSQTQFVFVMRPQELSVFETVRAARELKGQGIKPFSLIANGVLPEEAGNTPTMNRRRSDQLLRIGEAEKTLGLTARNILLRPTDVKGRDALLEIAGELYDKKRPALLRAGQPCELETTLPPSPDVNSLFAPLPGKTKTIFFTGKGGVGKTTVSCLTALNLAKLGHKTLLVTTDPAAHLGQVLDRPVGLEPTPITSFLDAVHIDQVSAFKEYKERILKEAAKTVSEEMLRATAEELESPCTEEMAAFDKFAGFLEEDSYRFIVIDTAPTGHTLRLLELPFQFSEQIATAVKDADNASALQKAADQRFKNLIARLKNPKETVFSFVFYPEATPVMESHRAFLDLRAAGINAQLLVANMVLQESQANNPFLKSRRAMHHAYLKEAYEKFHLPVLVLPQSEMELKGVDVLNNLPWIAEQMVPASNNG